jgi:hypothetical protein
MDFILLNRYTMEKKALLGISNNVETHFNKIKLWALSFKKVAQGNVYLICINANDREIELCKNIGVIPVSVELSAEKLGYINHERLLFTKNFLENCLEELFIITDVFDVVFQQDPFEKLDLNVYDLFAGREGVKINEEPWNFHNVKALFPQDIDACVGVDIVCSGVIAGKKDALIWLYNQMYVLCENSTDQHNIKDQAALNVMFAKNQIPKFKLFDLNEAWTVHCAVAGPTQFFKAWGFEDNLKRQNIHIPYIENGQVKTNGTLFDIVHQFNRIPEWNDCIYNYNIPSNE